MQNIFYGAYIDFVWLWVSEEKWNQTEKSYIFLRGKEELFSIDWCLAVSEVCKLWDRQDCGLHVRQILEVLMVKENLLNKNHVQTICNKELFQTYKFNNCSYVKECNNAISNNDSVMVMFWHWNQEVC